MKLEKETVKRYARLFTKDKNFYAFNYALPHEIDEEGKKRYEKNPWFIEQKIDLKTYIKHLRAPHTQDLTDWGLILPPINDKNEAWYGAIDVDVYNNKDLIKRVVKQIYDEKLPLAPCFSKSGGLHLYLFARHQVQAKLIVRGLRYFNKHLNTKAKEIFPKQETLKVIKGKQQVGNGILLPYRNSIKAEQGEEFQEIDSPTPWIMNEELETGGLKDFVDYADSIKVRQSFFIDLPLDLKEKKETKKKESNARPLSEALQKILTNIKNKKEHSSGGTFDNWIVAFVYKAMEDNMEDTEILEHLATIKSYSEKTNDDDYFPAKIRNCREKFGKLDPGPLREWLIKNLIWIMDIEKFWDNTTKRSYKETSVEKRYGHLAPSKSTIKSWYTKHSAKQDAEEIIYRPDLYNPDTPRLKLEDKLWYLNKYKPSDNTPKRPETHRDLDPFMELMDYLIPDENYKNKVLDWLAFIVQNPGRKIRYAILVYSSNWQIGKGSLFEVMTDILGEDNAEPSNVRAILDKGVKFAEKQLILVDECKSKGDFGEKSNLINDLKTIITERRIQQRVLYKDYRTIKTFTNYIIFTNNKDALSISPDDARYFVLFNEEERLDQDFYDHFHLWREKDGSSFVHWFLRNRDLSKFRPNAPAPETEFRKEMALEGEHPLTMKLREWIEEGRHPFSLEESVRSSSELTDWISENCKGEVVKYANNSKTLAKSLKDLGCIKIGQVLHKRRGDKPTLWIFRNHKNLSSMQNTDVCNEIWKPIIKYGSAEEVREERQTDKFIDNQEEGAKLYSEELKNKNETTITKS